MADNDYFNNNAGTGVRLFRGHYPSLDLLRSTAIILVMLRHYSELFFIPKDMALSSFLLWGSNGVALFFALSGFLIGGQIIEELMHGDFSFRRFYFKRFWRIFPPYYFSLAVVAVVVFAGLGNDYIVEWKGTGDTIKSLLYHSVYLQNYHISSLPSIQRGIYWTLALEEQFYLIIPLLLFLLSRYRAAYMAVALAVIILFEIILRIAVYAYLDGTDYIFDHVFLHPLHMRFDSLLFGVLAAFIFIYLKKTTQGEKAWAYVFFIIGAVATGITIASGMEGASEYTARWHFTLTGLGFSALTLWGALSRVNTLLPFKRFFAAIAKLSYTMYLYHIMLLLPLVTLIDKFYRMKNMADLFIGFVIYFILVTVISSAIYFVIDRPSMKYRKKRLLMAKEAEPSS